MIVAAQQVTVTWNRTRLTVLSNHLFRLNPISCMDYDDGTRHDHRVPFLLEMTTKTTEIDWPTTLRIIKSEVTRLSHSERRWLEERIAVIEETQLALDELFRRAGGVEACTACDGACCRCGRHHFTLTNLLAYILSGEDPPAPDFDRTCPYLGDQGCLLSVSRRPYNCITFFCETVDDRLDVAESEQLLELDKRLRREYQHVAERYPGASLRGLWIALERTGDGPLLCLPENVVE